MKKIILMFCYVALAYLAQAQAPNYTWAKKISGTSSGDYTTANKIAVDASGNVYTIGNFDGTDDFNPGTGTFTMTASGGMEDVFISKLDATGNFLWAKRVGSTDIDTPLDLKVDASGNVYVVGTFQGVVDFNPGTGVSNLTSQGDSDGFVLKLDASGNFVWAKQIGGQFYDIVKAIDVDASSNVYITGRFTDAVDLDPGTGVFNALSTSNLSDAFITKLNSSGNFVWAKVLQGSSEENPNAIKVDASGNVYTVGWFSLNIDLDPGAAVDNHTISATSMYDAFISKLDASGNFVWGKAISGNDAINASDFDVDNSGNVYITGDFSGTADFNPGTGTSNLTSVGNNGSSDIYILKLNSSGNYQWVKRMWGAGFDLGIGLALDPSANIYVTGSFYAVTDFDSGAGVFDLTPTGDNDAFILKMDMSGNFVWAGKVGGVSSDEGYGIALDPLGSSLVVTGYFQTVTDFNPGTGTANLTPVGIQDAFILKMCLPATAAGAIAGSTTVVSGGTATYSISTVSGATGYTWTVPAGATINSGQGTTSINVTFGTTSGSVIVTPTNSCGNSQSTSQFIAIAGTCLSTIDISTANTTICSGSAVFSSTVTNGGTTPSYQWKKNGNNVGSNIPTYSPSTLVNGDIISCVLTSTLSCASPSVVTSNSITMTVSSSVAPSITISTPNSAICGSSAVFSSTITNGGSAPAYQWKKNGSNVGSNIPTYSPTTLVNGDNISCVITSNASCATSSVAVSNTITMTVGTSTVVSTIIISTPDASICGGSAVFSSTITNGGTSPTYRWKKNGGNVGSNIPTYSPTSLVNGDVISCILTSNLSCASSTAVTSNSITMVVGSSTVAPTIMIGTPSNTVCAGSAVFTATITNGGTAPTYQWTKNASNVGSNISTYSPTTLINGDVIACYLTSNSSCASPTLVVSNSITMIVSASACTGIEDVTGEQLQLSVHPNPTNGILYIDVTNTDKYSVKLCDELGRVLFTEENSKIIETSQYSNGIYYVSISKAGRTTVKKVVIAN